MTNQSDWSPCEPGTLNDLRTQLTRKSASAQWTRRGVITAVATAAAGGVWMVLSADQAQGQKLTCDQVSRHAEAYVRNELDADTRQQVDEHRRSCRPCDAKLTQLEQQQKTA